MSDSSLQSTRAPGALRCGRYTLQLGRRPLVMGILNVTPDSFSDGGRYNALDAALVHARAMADAGADMIDIGGESTRPGSLGVAVEEELDRVVPVIDALTAGAEGAPGVPLSIDTHKPEVAREALRRGCSMVNDISGAENPGMLAVLREFGDIPIVVMHKRGDPRTMQENPSYDDVVAEVAAYLRDRADALNEQGISPGRVILDPGIGFGKRLRDNLELLNHIDALRALGYPVMIGASRKRFIGDLTGAEAGSRLPGSLAVAARCYARGVDIIRVHDVVETVAVLDVLDAIEHPEDHARQEP